MESVSGATIFQWLGLVAIAGLGFFIKTLQRGIQDAKKAAEDAAAKAEKDLGEAKAAIMVEIHDTVTEATNQVRAVAEEGKRLAVQSLDRLNQHELHVARNHPTNAAIDKLEAQIAGVGRTISSEIKALSIKLDGKQDKAGGAD